MKNIVYILIFLKNLTFGQTVKLTEPEIEKYSKSIDKLRTENILVKISYPNMSAFSDGLDGYYLNKKTKITHEGKRTPNQKWPFSN